MEGPSKFNSLPYVSVKYHAAGVLTVALAVLLWFGCAASRERIPVILDHDGATDDYLALLMLAGSRCCEIRGVTVSYGLGHRDAALKATGMILQTLELDVPVAGHDSGLRGPNSFPDDWRDTSDRVMGLPILRDERADLNHTGSARLLVELLEDSETPVTLIATGPLTNIADLITQRPDLLAKIDRLVVMGGALDVPGNVRDPETVGATGPAEYNFYVDPVSADQVLESAQDGLDITLAPLDVTRELKMSTEWLARLQGHDSFGARLAAGILGGVEPRIAAGEYYLWDGATVLVLLSPQSVRMKKLALSVERAGPEQGRLRRDSSRTATVKAATGVMKKSQPLETALRWISDAKPGL